MKLVGRLLALATLVTFSSTFDRPVHAESEVTDLLRLTPCQRCAFQLKLYSDGLSTLSELERNAYREFVTDCDAKCVVESSLNGLTPVSEGTQSQRPQSAASQS